MNLDDLRDLTPEELMKLPKPVLEQMAYKLEALGKRTYRDYVPLSYQKEWHESPASIRLFLGGNRSGKTIASFHDVWWQLTGNYPDWYPEDLKLITPVYSRWITGLPFKEGIGSIFQQYYEELGIKSEIKRVIKTNQGFPAKIFFNNGSQLELMSKEQDIETFEGWHGHRVHIDEPIKREQYIASKRGLIDYGGRISFSLTPLSQPWIYDELYEKADGARIFQVTVNTADNKTLDPREIAEFEASLTDDEKEARLHGKFTHLAGMVYKEFDRNIHVVPSFEIPRDWKIVMCLDPHDRRPHCITWAAVDPYDTLYFFDEMEYAGTVRELVEEIRRREAMWNMWPNKKLIRQVKRLIDPNKGKAPAKVGDKGDLIQTLNKHKMHFFGAINDDLTDGHLAVKQYMKYDKSKPVGERNHPQLYITNNCKKIIHGITHYLWDEYRDTADKSSKEKPKDLHKDFPDCVRYTVILKPRYKAPPIKISDGRVY